jgi:hypothetical protein
LLVALAPINQNGWRRLHLTEALTVLAVAGMRGAALGLVFASALVRRRLLILEARRRRIGCDAVAAADGN